jgi:hypothetical protein
VTLWNSEATLRRAFAHVLTGDFYRKGLAAASGV